MVRWLRGGPSVGASEGPGSGGQAGKVPRPKKVLVAAELEKRKEHPTLGGPSKHYMYSSVVTRPLAWASHTRRKRSLIAGITTTRAHGRRLGGTGAPRPDEGDVWQTAPRLRPQEERLLRRFGGGTAVRPDGNMRRRWLDGGLWRSTRLSPGARGWDGGSRRTPPWVFCPGPGGGAIAVPHALIFWGGGP